jgi:hypothetical protein
VIVLLQFYQVLRLSLARRITPSAPIRPTGYFRSAVRQQVARMSAATCGMKVKEVPDIALLIWATLALTQLGPSVPSFSVVHN